MDTEKKHYFKVVLILGSLTALSPFSIDMYLSAFPMMAKGFGTTVAQVSMTLSSYFIGLASGQLFYGPLMDRFGRKKPLYFGLLLYIFASLACAGTRTIESLIVLRFIQALGACSAGVGAFAMVRDLFEPRESVKVFSSLVLILGTSPLLAPTIGGYFAVHFGWPSVFIALAAAAGVLLFVVARYLPESHTSDGSHRLHPGEVVRNYLSIIREPQFYSYAVAGALGFSGLFVYLAASPTIFMEKFGVSEEIYGWIFAVIAMGLVGMSQLNVVLIKKFSNERILGSALVILVGISFTFLFLAMLGLDNLYIVVVILFFFLAFMGLSNPNSAALAMAPFKAKAGSAASLVGFLQMGIGSLASVSVGVLKVQELVPLASIMTVTSGLALLIFLLGSRTNQRQR